MQLVALTSDKPGLKGATASVKTIYFVLLIARFGSNFLFAQLKFIRGVSKYLVTKFKTSSVQIETVLKSRTIILSIAFDVINCRQIFYTQIVLRYLSFRVMYDTRTTRPPYILFQ